MKRIAMVADDVALPGENGLGRMFYLAEYFCRNGFSVNLITGKFQHWEKRYREEGFMDKVFGQTEVTFVNEPAYRKNIDIKRIYSYRVMASNIISHLESRDYDLLYCQIPDNHLAYLAGCYAKRKGIPFILDIEDLWPEAMKMLLPFNMAGKALLYPFAADAKKAYELADAVTGSSDTYRDEPFKYNIDIKKRITVYAGTDLEAFDKGAEDYMKEIIVPEGKFLVTYAGTLGRSYDLRTLIRASKLTDGVHVFILGDGPERKELEALAIKLNAPVTFTGYQPYPVMAAYLKKSDAVVNSLIKKAPQGITSKTGDYLAAGKPVINTGTDKEFCEKTEKDGFGINIASENVKALTCGIQYLKENPQLCDEMGRRARLTALKEFDREKTYMRIVELVRTLI